MAGSSSIPCEITCSSIRMSYFGGPVLSSAKVEGVFWGSGTYTAGAGPGGEMPAFYDAIGASDWWAGLTEYDTTISGGTNQIIAPVSSIGETTITPSAPNDGSTITDAEMQNELAAQITAGHLPAPALDSTGNVETDYALYFPDNKIVCLVAGECNTNDFCAYHNSFSYDGLNVPYMVLPAFTPGTADASGCGTLPTLTDDYTSTVSHELVEAATDTGIGLDTASDYAYPAAWGDNNNNVGEVMDACDTGSNADSATLPGTGYYVQAIFSNVAAGCVFSRPYLNLSPTVATIQVGGSQTYTATTDGPTNVSSSTTFTVTPATGVSCTGDVCTASQPGSYVVRGSEGALSSDAVDLTVTAAECAPGTYSATGLAPCTDAPPGTFVATSGATSATPCATGTYNPFTGQVSCVNAPTGTYVASTGATSATECPAGTYNPDTGSTTAAACLPADAGSFVADPGSAAETPCAAGSYSPSTGATACTLADAGSFVASTGSTGETPCAAGSYSPTTGATACTLADAGSFVASSGSTSETPCADGSYSSTTGASACTLADAGSFVASTGSTGETPCAAGSYSSTTGASACTLADAGSFVASTGSTSETPCAAGSYSPTTGATACTLASPGHFVSSPGATAQQACAIGSFSSSSGASACTLAPPGSFVSTPGATTATKCPLGAYLPTAGGSKCLVAPLNTYVAVVGATAATKCPTGTFTLQTGSTSKADCLELAITTTKLPGGTLYSASKVAYSAKLAVKGGQSPYHWALTSGSKLPPGLSLGTSSGVIAGRATKVGTYSFTVKVTDTKSATQGAVTAYRKLSITIAK
ncbi:MAG TPA: putative Ig domain-containing protein [Acidimicrobiales bacterium]|nr:putative Ig domain-containing protein [Acidimicrobiales bacterium]